VHYALARFEETLPVNLRFLWNGDERPQMSKLATSPDRKGKEAEDTAADARRAVEKRLGEPVASAQNFRDQPKKMQKSLSPTPQPTLFDLQEPERPPAEEPGRSSHRFSLAHRQFTDAREVGT